MRFLVTNALLITKLTNYKPESKPIPDIYVVL